MFTYFKPHTLTLDRASPRRAHVRPRALALSPGELRRSAIALAERCFTPVALRWRESNRVQCKLEAKLVK